MKQFHRASRLLSCLFLGCSLVALADHNPPPLPDPIPGSIPTGPYVLEFATLASGSDFLPFGFPVDVEAPDDGSGRLFVTFKEGLVQIIDGGSVLATPFLDLTASAANNSGTALSSIAFHPKFAVAGDAGEGLLYTVYQEPAGSGLAHFGDPATAAHQSVVYEWQVSAADPNVADVGTKREILRVNEQIVVHNVNDLVFGPDGYLYIAKGDDDADVNSVLDGTTVNGTILRIDVDDPSGNGRYSIPDTNPFVDGADGKLAEVYAYGFRNLWRMSFDSLTGALYAADIGEDDIEEIDLIQPGENYGWIDKEGSFAFLNFNGVTDDLTDLPPGFDGVDPLAEYDHTENDRSITGGFVYRGNLVPSLRGHYVFGDLVSGRLMNLDPLTLTIQEISIDSAGDAVTTGLIGLGQTAAGELLLVFANTAFTATLNRVDVLVSGSGAGIDGDGDGIDDDVDNCIYVSNQDQDDNGGIATTVPDGIGDACQCGDVNNNGIVDNTDAILIKRDVLGLPPGVNPDKCNVNAGETCDNTDAILIQRAVLGLPPGIAQECSAANISMP